MPYLIQIKTACQSIKDDNLVKNLKKRFPVIPAKAGIQDRLKILDSGSRFACPE
jgi:hypothetical protein